MEHFLRDTGITSLDELSLQAIRGCLLEAQVLGAWANETLIHPAVAVAATAIDLPDAATGSENESIVRATARFRSALDRG